MPTKTSAGVLPFRRTAQGLEVFLVHPGGPFWARKDDGAWSIAKGEHAADEAPLDAARREFAEETGFAPDGSFLELQPVRQAGGKEVRAWAIEAELDPSRLTSNRFPMEWPPKSGRIQEFPEVDRAAWFPIDEARRKILKGQRPLLDQLEALLRGQ